MSDDQIPSLSRITNRLKKTIRIIRSPAIAASTFAIGTYVFILDIPEIATKWGVMITIILVLGAVVGILDSIPRFARWIKKIYHSAVEILDQWTIIIDEWVEKIERIFND
jgi:hypothetical protein